MVEITHLLLIYAEMQQMTTVYQYNPLKYFSTFKEDTVTADE